MKSGKAKLTRGPGKWQRNVPSPRDLAMLPDRGGERSDQ